MLAVFQSPALDDITAINSVICTVVRSMHSTSSSRGVALYVFFVMLGYDAHENPNSSARMSTRYTIFGYTFTVLALVATK